MRHERLPGDGTARNVWIAVGADDHGRRQAARPFVIEGTHRAGATIITGFGARGVGGEVVRHELGGAIPQTMRFPIRGGHELLGGDQAGVAVRRRNRADHVGAHVPRAVPGTLAGRPTGNTLTRSITDLQTRICQPFVSREQVDILEINRVPTIDGGSPSRHSLHFRLAFSAGFAGVSNGHTEQPPSLRGTQIVRIDQVEIFVSSANTAIAAKTPPTRALNGRMTNLPSYRIKIVNQERTLSNQIWRRRPTLNKVKIDNLHRLPVVTDIMRIVNLNYDWSRPDKLQRLVSVHIDKGRKKIQV